MPKLSETGSLPPVQAVFELVGLECGAAMRAAETVEQLTAAGGLHEKAQVCEEEHSGPAEGTQ